MIVFLAFLLELFKWPACFPFLQEKAVANYHDDYKNTIKKLFLQK